MHQRPYQGERDLGPVLDLLQTCASAGHVDMELSSLGLRTLLRDPNFDTQRTVLCIEGDELAGFGVLWTGRHLGMLVLPARRGSLEFDILEWAADHVRRAPESGPGARRLYVLCRSDDADGRGLLERTGFSLADIEWRMGRPLDEPIPAANVPDGFTIRPLDGPRELDDWLSLYAELFPGNTSHPRRWRRLRDDPDWLPALDLIAVGTAGRLAGACTCTIPAIEAAQANVHEGRTEPVMVRPQYQGLGLGRALVLTGLLLLREHGINVAMLTTEADNDSAHRLYTRLGYRHLYDACWYGRNV